jgi:ABC-type sugar transport system ATPase subunit
MLAARLAEEDAAQQGQGRKKTRGGQAQQVNARRTNARSVLLQEKISFLDANWREAKVSHNDR